MSVAPDPVLLELQAQHAALLEMIARCEEMADQLDAGQGDAVRLWREVARLRATFQVHRTFDGPLRPAHGGTVRAARTDYRTRAGQAHALRDVLASLRAHLALEEGSR